MIYLFYVLFMFQVKHLICDWYLQSPHQVACKGIYGNPAGISHSLDHVIGTIVVFMLTIPNMLFDRPLFVLSLAFADGVVHYHVDWIKMKFGCKDPSQHKFWCNWG